MLKKLAIGAGIVVFAVPVFATADIGGSSTQLISLYTQLIQLLQQELTWLQNNKLSIAPLSGSAPLTSVFTLNTQTGTEAIDFGDGHSTGSSGCVKNAGGYCDLSKPVSHTYALPGTYKVSVYQSINGTSKVIGTQTVTVK